jgi:competence protein ComEA
VFKFTKEEKIVLVFLIGSVLLGSSFLYLKKRNPAPFSALEFKEPDEAPSEKININNATMDELIGIKGLGRSLAGRIIDYREREGRFASVEDIKNVKGIGEKKFQSIKERICVE